MKHLQNWVKTLQLTAAFTVLPAKTWEQHPGQSAGVSPSPKSYGRNEKPCQPAGAWWRAGFRGLTVLMLLTAFLPLYAQPTIQWDKTIGSSEGDFLFSLQQTRDGGYILGGSTDSGISGDKTEASRGSGDYWVVKLDAAGNKVWDKTIGGSGNDQFTLLQQTIDGGYILGGYSFSGSGGDKTEANKGEADYWVVKLDSSGNRQWDKTLGGSGDDRFESLQHTREGGYILGGYSYSGISGDKTEASRGDADYWVVQLDAAGTKQWDKTIGGGGTEIIKSLRQTRDGGYILGGYSNSGIDGDKTQASRGATDYWVVKLNPAGNKQWDKTFGGSGEDALYDLQQTLDGGYFLGGASYSGLSGDKTQASRGNNDFWVVKLDAAGNKQWDKTFGSSGYDILESLQQTLDAGYILGGWSGSGTSSDKTEASKGRDDFWVVKLDAAGNKQWDKTLGGPGWELLHALQQTRDGGYILGGSSDSDISGDKTEAPKGRDDYWVVKLAPFPETHQVSPQIEWDKTIGGSDFDLLNALQQTRDGGYILGGTSNSDISGDKTDNRRVVSDYWVVKLDAAGNKQWDKTFGGSGGESLHSLQQTRDGGYILGGTSASGTSGEKSEASKGREDYWVVKLDAAGNKQWDRTIGGSDLDGLHSLQQTQDGGYILGGWSTSPNNGDKTETFKGTADYWVVKLDAAGNKVWDRTIGGDSWDQLEALQQTSDGGYILGGWSYSRVGGDKTEDPKGRFDYWVVKLDATGNKQWDKTIGGHEGDGLTALQQTRDGGYILGGYSSSGIGGDKTEASRGSSDYWVVKLNAAGNKQWDKTYGGNANDYLSALQQTNDGGFLLGGTSESGISGDKTEANRAGCLDNSCPADYWIVKLDAAGNKQWDKTIGSNGEDDLTALQQTRDGGYILGGSSGSPISGDKTEATKGENDYWIVRLGPLPETLQVKSFTLINTQSEQPIRTLNDGDILDLADLPKKLNIRADTEPDTVGSVQFELRGQQDRTHVENQAPYALFGHKRGDYEKWHPAPGSYTLTATPYTESNAQGEAGTSLTIHFTVKPPQVERFTLINTQSELPIRPLQDGDILDLADLPKKLNIRADTDPALVGSVQFELRGQQTRTYVENQAPYALLGHNRGDYHKWNPAPGSYTLTATPYTESNAQGEAGTPLTIRFTVVSKQAATLAARRGLAPELAARLTLYPNPTSDGRLQVQLAEQVRGPLRYCLLSSGGRKLAEGTIPHAGNLLKFDFSRQLRVSGLYYLRLEGAHGQQTFKILRR